MVVRLIVVVLRLSALYFLWQTISLFGAYQFAFSYEREGPFIGIAITIVMLLVISGTLWFFAGRLAPHIYPYGDQDDMPISLDVDRLEIVIVQIIGLILVVIGLHGLISALLTILLTNLDLDRVVSAATILLSLIRGALFGLLGLVLLMKFKGVLHWLSRLRKAGAR
jgi:hypothetical protein